MDDIRYITTAIVYPNARIHVGWAWECLGADWLTRCERAFGHQTFFATGMDEHSLNVQKAAESKGLTPQVYCDEMATEIKKVLGQMGMSYDRFIRTSDPDHVFVVQKLVQRAFDQGDIYQAKYEGHYCESCEAYYTDKDLVNGNCPSHKKPTRWLSENNYFFKLSKYEKPLLELFRNQPDFLRPKRRASEVINFIEAGLKDFSISRSNFTWGIPLPFDPKQVIYVWFDALINYLTAAGYEFKLKDPGSKEAEKFDRVWNGAFHIIGKDISRFHCVYWPAMLMSLGLPLPKQVFAHGFINIKGEKMSKSTGNIVTPDEVIQKTGSDPFRYYLLAENHFDHDGSFEWEALVKKANSDLANDWGNLVNRSISMTRKYFPDREVKLPEKRTHSVSVYQSFEKMKEDLKSKVDEVSPSGYAAACVERSRVLNLYIDQMKPWKMAKELKESKEIESSLEEALATILEGIRWIATAFLPLLPDKMPEVFKQLGVPAPELQSSLKNLEWGAYSFRPETPSPIYPRIELE